MDSDLKKKAAIAAVLYYVKAEEELQQQIRPPVVARMPSPWQLQGRQSMMHMRNLIQRRVLKRI
ncbi:MAG: hypothetical protein JW881_16115 [Spirochaetales bacterium]|nr:hypothetical protein [Spirochaetales bacterium]